MAYTIPSPLTIDDIKTRFLPPPGFDYNKAREEEEARKAMVKAEVYSILARIINDLPGVTSIEVCGYTPSFSYGDRCTHRQRDPNVNGVNCDDYDERHFDSYRDGFDPDDYSDEMVDDDTYALIRAICNGMADMFEDAFDTDFSVTVSRDKNGNFIYEIDSYDCGY